MPAGRFAGERYFPEREHVPQWLWDVSPRFSMAYDLFGDGRTALKASFSRYLDPLTGGFADRYSPGAAQRDAQLVRLHDQRGRQRVRDRRVRCRPTATTSRRPTRSARVARRSASARIATSIPTFSASATPKSRSACSISCSRACRSSRSTIAARSRTWRCSIASSSRTADYTSFQAPLPADVARDPEVAAIMSPGRLVTGLQPAAGEAAGLHLAAARQDESGSDARSTTASISR